MLLLLCRKAFLFIKYRTCFGFGIRQIDQSFNKYYDFILYFGTFIKSLEQRTRFELNFEFRLIFFEYYISRVIFS